MTNTNEKKMTKRDYFAMVRAMVEGSGHEKENEILSFIDHEIELLDNRKSSSKPTKAQVENTETMDTIATVLAESAKPMTVSELMEDSRLTDFSNQKITSLLTLMGKANRVVRVVEKKKAYYSLA